MIALLMLIILMVGLLLPVPTGKEIAAYNTLSHLAYSPTRSTCLHEIAHALDQRAGWVSRTPEFGQAAELYLYTEFRKPVLTELPARVLDTVFYASVDRLAMRREIYAVLFQFAEGDEQRMPESLRGFYDWDLAQHYMSRITPTQTLYWLH